jgi:hypothetical protein
VFSDNEQPHQANSDTSDSGIRVDMLGELRHDWCETLSQVAWTKIARGRGRGAAW